jgi:hypothetical protein
MPFISKAPQETTLTDLSCHASAGMRQGRSGALGGILCALPTFSITQRDAICRHNLGVEYAIVMMICAIGVQQRPVMRRSGTRVSPPRFGFGGPGARRG